MTLPSDCFSKATVSTRSYRPEATWVTAVRAVDAPTDPAVCTRSIGFMCAPRAPDQELLRLHHAFEHVRRLADDHRIDVLVFEPGIRAGRDRRLRAPDPAMFTSARREA